MEYRYLGKTGVKVSSLCMGTWLFGSEIDEATATDMFHLCRESGINFFDSANFYGQGRAEEILGKLISDCRDEIILTSKFYYPVNGDINASGASRRHIMQAIEDSLKRLGTDRIDFYYVHHFDDFTPLEETLRALDDLVHQGKILYPAASNFAAWQISKALGIASCQGWAPFECIQPMYNLVKRQAEVEIFPMAIHEKLGVTTYNPLGGGLLTGKYGTGLRPSSGRLVESPGYKIRYGEEWMYEVASNFGLLARDVGIHPAALAIGWVASHPAVTAPILGARTLEQLDVLLQSIKIDMNSDLVNRINTLSPEPPLATDRTEERSVSF